MKFNDLNYDVCEYLEGLNISYKEMQEYLVIKVSPSQISKAFKKYGIKHKTKIERIQNETIKKGIPLKELAKRYNVSERTISYAKEKGFKKMIRYSIIKNDDEIDIKIIGHSNYDIEGKDIVCASISSLIQYTERVLTTLKENIESYQEKGFYRLKIKKPLHITKQIIITLKDTIKEIEKQYPLNVKECNE